MSGAAGNRRIRVVQGDITAQTGVDAMVNAANSQLMRGGGVCGAIHRAAGPKLEDACAAIGHCPTGGAVATDAFDLPCRHIIHAVGPVWEGGAHGEDDLLASAYRESLRVAAALGCRSIAFPSISTGIYGFPMGRAASVAVAAVVAALAGLPDFDEVRLVCFSGRDARIYAEALDALH